MTQANNVQSLKRLKLEDEEVLCTERTGFALFEFSKEIFADILLLQKERDELISKTEA